MKFKANSRRKVVEYEKDLIEYWKHDDTFKKSIEQRPEDNSYVFYDGPPFITGLPHYGTLLSSIIKDAIPRYQTMKGKRVERRWGWDCHGLPAENFVEKKLGITDRHDIGTKISLADYIKTARESMVQVGDSWESTVDRIGRWVDFENAYKTMDKNFMESIWWAFKTLYDKGKIYEGEKILLYDTEWATPLSKAEVTMDSDAYVEVTDPSVYVKFKLTDEDVYLLAWTTTPWTLPANSALAINPKAKYSEVELNGEKLILATDLMEKALTDEKNQPLNYKVLKEIPADELIGKTYEPLFVNRGLNAHKIWSAKFVTLETGTGIVHIAPAYGEDDFALAQEKQIPVVHVLDDYGQYTETEWQGEKVWQVNKLIAKTLHDRGVVLKIEYIRHEYPHNPRTGNRLIYRAHPSWFMDIDGQRAEMLEKNSANINWFPENIKHGRFENNIKQAPDWNLSRDRFWATAMPVWKGVDAQGKEHIKVVGNYAELKELSGVELEDYHRPWVDEIEFDIDDVHYKRIDKVLDCWFESGSMPFAQFHYPFENVEKFEKSFPGDFVVEYIGQVRAWFYYLNAVSIGIFDSTAFKNVIVTGNVAGNDGRKMSKSYGNYTDPNILMDQYGADSIRFLLLSSPLLSGEDFALRDKDIKDVSRKLSMIWNMYDFFTMYAAVDGWEFDGDLSDPYEQLKNPLDQWIVSRLHQLIQTIDDGLGRYDIPYAIDQVLPFVDDASNWYVRRSRRRFWKSGDDADKNLAYKTLHYVLVNLAIAMAPFTPFLSEELYRKLTGGESVHLLNYPEPGLINIGIIDEMKTVREYVSQGLSERARQHIKVRQPLASVTIKERGKLVDFDSILKEELNVKEIRLGSEFSLDTNISPELKKEGLVREAIRYIQNARKLAGLNVDDRINLGLQTDDGMLKQTLSDYGNLIMSETLATSIVDDVKYSYRGEVSVGGAGLTISLEK